ncbi:hypothetical protein L798_08238 [Zootermopsis nevadensis]|uniref:Uncharacterized protein n=1 Tax=Zootermopsis nevadensis TaxID=136037 RepID=A0A067R626_ZOONE|nr:hypothetical protein L798_08238 [Zootermopsis nevadensis]
MDRRFGSLKLLCVEYAGVCRGLLGRNAMSDEGDRFLRNVYKNAQDHSVFQGVRRLQSTPLPAWKLKSQCMDVTSSLLLLLRSSALAFRLEKWQTCMDSFWCSSETD